MAAASWVAGTWAVASWVAGIASGVARNPSAAGTLAARKST